MQTYLTINLILITFTYCSPHMLGRYYSHLSLSKVFASSKIHLVYYLLLIIPTLQETHPKGNCYLSMNDQLHESGLQWNTSCEVCRVGWWKISVKTNLIGFLSTNNGLDGYVCVCCTQGEHSDGVKRGGVTLIRQYPEDSGKKSGFDGHLLIGLWCHHARGVNSWRWWCPFTL